MWVIILFKKAVVTFLCFIILFTSNAFAKDKEEISAKSAVCIDFQSGEVLFEKDIYMRMPMASTTKIMTCLLACEKGNVNKTVTVTKEMLRGCEGTLLYLKEGDRIMFSDLIKGALIASGNDAANAIAFAVAGSIDSFVLLMNEKAETLNMTNTSFKTPSGLDSDGHYSCAYDMAVLTRYAMKNSLFRSIVSMKSAEITINGKTQRINNHNKLLQRDSSFIGVKTGYTRKAGRCLVSDYAFDSAEIITVTLNASDDWDDHLMLVNEAKKKYNIKTVVGEVIIPAADGSNVNCHYSCGVNSVSDVYVRLYYYPFIYSPYKSGDAAGYALVYTNNALLKKTDIIIT